MINRFRQESSSDYSEPGSPEAFAIPRSTAFPDMKMVNYGRARYVQPESHHLSTTVTEIIDSYGDGLTMNLAMDERSTSKCGEYNYGPYPVPFSSTKSGTPIPPLPELMGPFQRPMMSGRSETTSPPAQVQQRTYGPSAVQRALRRHYTPTYHSTLSSSTYESCSADLVGFPYSSRVASHQPISYHNVDSPNTGRYHVLSRPLNTQTPANKQYEGYWLRQGTMRVSRKELKRREQEQELAIARMTKAQEKEATKEAKRLAKAAKRS